LQTFAWRLLPKALPTSKRASRFSKHIEPECSRCGCVEDEMYIPFYAPFSKATSHRNIPEIIQALLSSLHHDINIASLHPFLWSLWNVRNDRLFNRKLSSSAQIFAISNDIMQGN
jgi:hypothetical protein